MIPAIEWQFGGSLRHWPAPAAWGALAALAVGGAVFVAWMYRRTLRMLPPGARGPLTLLRAAVVLMVLACLANPVRVERRPLERSSRDTLAVVVDRSDSMTTVDHRGVTRLASATQLWKQHEAQAAKAFPRTIYRHFAVTAAEDGDLDAALHAHAPGAETHLYDALRQTLELTPGAIVCLTDGLDTTSGDAGALAAEAQRRGVPLYFAPGTNRALAGESMSIRAVKAPSQVLRQTQFTASALLEISSAHEQELPVELWSGPTRLAADHLHTRAGANTLPWNVQVTANEPGPMPLEFRAGADAKQQIAACTAQVVDRTKIEVLYYQGALEWGYRYLLAALEGDPSFHMTSILNPSLDVQMNVGSRNHAVLPDLPDNARALRPFQIVVLAHVFADRLSDRQQRALTEYARGGGGVLFIAPDTEATQRFAGTALEQMLPVVFEPDRAPRTEDDLAQRFREQMAGADNGGEPLFNDVGRQQSLPRLQPFTLPPGATQATTAAVFRDAAPAGMPKFCDYAKVRAVKSGADVLAVKGGDGPPRVLLARQPFGAGFTAALTTDLLWRWKMSVPSASRAPETFWQQLLLSLRPPPGAGLRLDKLTLVPAVHVAVALRVEGTANAAPVAEAVSPDGRRLPLALREAKGSGQDGAQWEASFVPDAAGRWQVGVTDPAQGFARVTFPVSDQASTAESLDLPPDVEGMRRLAQSTGGELIGNEPVFQDRTAPQAAGEAPPGRVEPVWDSKWLLGLLLGLYGTELILRRWFRLL